MEQSIRYLTENGVIHELSVVRTPQQNGRAERLNRTLIEKVRAMLLEHDSPKILWSEAIYAASEARNYVPSAGLKHSPFERFYGSKPSVAHLRVFGCHASVHLHKSSRDKLDSVAVTGTLVGYASHSKAWRILLPDGDRTWRIIESADVKFIEDRAGDLPRSMRSKEATARKTGEDREEDGCEDIVPIKLFDEENDEGDSDDDGDESHSNGEGVSDAGNEGAGHAGTGGAADTPEAAGPVVTSPRRSTRERKPSSKLVQVE